MARAIVLNCDIDDELRSLIELGQRAANGAQASAAGRI